MNYAGIKYCDIANGLGCRTVLFVSGCRNHCKGCFQPQTWEFDYGEPFDEQIQNEILDSLKPAYVQGITLLGGDPFEEDIEDIAVGNYEDALPGLLPTNIEFITFVDPLFEDLHDDI